MEPICWPATPRMKGAVMNELTRAYRPESRVDRLQAGENVARADDLHQQIGRGVVAAQQGIGQQPGFVLAWRGWQAAEIIEHDGQFDRAGGGVRDIAQDVQLIARDQVIDEYRCQGALTIIDEAFAVEIIDDQLAQRIQGWRFLGDDAHWQVDDAARWAVEGAVDRRFRRRDIQRMAAFAGEDRQGLGIVTGRAGHTVVALRHIQQKGVQRSRLITRKQRDIARRSPLLAEHIIEKAPPKAAVALAEGEHISQHGLAADLPAGLIGMKVDGMGAIGIAIDQ